MSSFRTDAQFVWQFSLLVLLSILITMWGIFQAPLHALGNSDTQRDAYFFDQAGLLFSSVPDWSANNVWQHTEKEAVKLPDPWSLKQQNSDVQGWYQIDFRLDPDKPTPNALFMPKAIMNAHAYLNGHWIGGYGAMDKETSRHWNRPYLFQFPTGLLNERDNVLHIQVASYDSQPGGLGRVWLGTSAQLEPLYDLSYRWQVTGSMLATFVAWGSGFLILLFSRIFREREGFFFLGLAILVFAVRNTAYFLDWTPLPNTQLTQTLHSLHAWFACQIRS